MTQAEKLGKRVVEFFNLKKLNNHNKPYYNTTWGDKTLEGLGQCIFRLVEEAEDNKF